MVFVLKILSFLACYTPQIVVEALAKGLAFLFYDVFKIRRRLIEKNIVTAFPDLAASEVSVMGRASIHSFIQTYFEFLRSPRHSIHKNIHSEGAQHLEKALAEGHGVYIICCHLGNWEAMGGYLTHNFTNTHVVVKKVGSKAVNVYVEKLREHNGFLGIKRQKKGDAHTAIKKALSENEVVGFVMDQARPNEPRMKFFSKDATTNTSFAAIWRKNKAPIIPSYIERTSFGHHVVHILPEVKRELTENEQEDILQHSLVFNKVVESMIRRNPYQYFWIHNRWKS